MNSTVEKDGSHKEEYGRKSHSDLWDFSENYQILLRCPCAVVVHIQPIIIEIKSCSQKLLHGISSVTAQLHSTQCINKKQI
jgi:hypothetical protein